MHKNQDKENVAQGRTENSLDAKNSSTSISSVVKTEVYPQGRRRKEPTPPKHLPYTASMVEEYSIQTDPYGSYTGIPLDPSDNPVQDVDDL